MRHHRGRALLDSIGEKGKTWYMFLVTFLKPVRVCLSVRACECVHTHTRAIVFALSREYVWSDTPDTSRSGFLRQSCGIVTAWIESLYVSSVLHVLDF